ncbi:hypothetical protein BDZ45DRAFT_480665 [Acephala macrosclerotiorum]|nr:hypothetical protein BDZ45DRAFT_480665 [Acephala macrosclerotiorum]
MALPDAPIRGYISLLVNNQIDVSFLNSSTQLLVSQSQRHASNPNHMLHQSATSYLTAKQRCRDREYNVRSQHSVARGTVRPRHRRDFQFLPFPHVTEINEKLKSTKNPVVSLNKRPLHLNLRMLPRPEGMCVSGCH